MSKNDWGHLLFTVGWCLLIVAAGVAVCWFDWWLTTILFHAPGYAESAWIMQVMP